MENDLSESFFKSNANSVKQYPNTIFQLLLIFGMILFTYALIAGILAGLLAWTSVQNDVPQIVFVIVFGIFFLALTLLMVYGERKRGEKEREMIDNKLKEKQEESQQ